MPADGNAAAFPERPLVLRHADGIYLDMPMWEYLADDALGGHGIVKLATSAPDFAWERSSNPLWEEPKSDARALGTMVHTAVLEGLPAYDARYCAEPNRDDYPSALDTADQFRAFIRKANEAIEAASDWQPPRKIAGVGDAKALAEIINAEIAAHDLPPLRGDEKRPDLLAWIRARNEAIAEAHPPAPVMHALGGSKEELVERVRRIDPEVQIWDEIVAAHVAGREMIKARDDLYVRLVERFARHAYGHLLADGLSEVSVFFTDEGIRYKARFDRMTAPRIVDVKKFGLAPKLGNSLREHLVAEAGRLAYPVQAVMHSRAAYAAVERYFDRLGNFQIVASGENAAERTALCDKILRAWAQEGPLFTWLFLRCPGPPMGKPLPFRPNDPMWSRAEETIRDGVKNFRAFTKICGPLGTPDAMWIDAQAEEDIDDQDWPLWSFKSSREGF